MNKGTDKQNKKMKQFSILNKQTELLAPTAFAWGEVRYFIDDELNVWQVFKGDYDNVIEKNPDLYVQFDNTTQDINRLQKLKADHYKIESGTHGFSSDGSVAKDGIKPPPVFTGVLSDVEIIKSEYSLLGIRSKAIEDALDRLIKPKKNADNF